MTNAFIFHGTEGYPEENWFPWLKEKLESLNYKVFVPKFPTPENQTLENWFKVFEKCQEPHAKAGGVSTTQPIEKRVVLEHAQKPRFLTYKKYYTSDTILIGHSLGGTFLLRILEKYNIKIKAAYIVAAPIGILPIKNYDDDKLFIKDPFDWKKIKSRAKQFYVFHSDNDPYVCLENGEELAKCLEINLTFVPNAGHFNAKAGYLKFDLLLDKIKLDS